MFGWELPPYNSGGLGTATLGLTEGLAPLGVNIDLVLPKVFGPFPYDHMNILDACEYNDLGSLQSKIELSELEKIALTQALAYGNTITIDENKKVHIKFKQGQMPVSPDMQATWYAYQAAAIAKKHEFDLIHCHDWMTYYCGIAAKQVAMLKGQDTPFIAQIHATEHDRCGDHGNPVITSIEQAGLNAADRVVAVSYYTKKCVNKEYGVPLQDISVVHNGIPLHKKPEQFDWHALKKHYKIVLSMGRVTHQKGLMSYLRLAKQVTDRDPMVKFLLIGSGDMEKYCIEQSAKMGLTGKVLFCTFLRGKDVDKAYQMADLFVMPSISEPFGITALEAIQNNTPVIASKQSGVVECSNNIIAIDHWDVDAMTEATLRVLHDQNHHHNLLQGAKKDLNHLTWNHSAKTLFGVYQDILGQFKANAIASGLSPLQTETISLMNNI